MNQKKILLVCGGRDYADESLLFTWMSYALTKSLKVFKPEEVVVIHGAARGVDTLANNIAIRCGIEVRRYPADWNQYGKSAGFIRNQHMLDHGKPDLVLAAPGGRGTAHMVRISLERNIPVITFNEKELPRWR